VLTRAHKPLNQAILSLFLYIHLIQSLLSFRWVVLFKQVVREGSDEDEVPLAQRNRKVGVSTQGPRGHGHTNPPAAPRRSTGQGHRARTKQAHRPDDHYDDYEDISLDTLSSFVLRPSRPPRPAGMMGILKMVDYTRGSHNVYKERYTDPALWQK
jgi:hypothetical protein